MAHHSLFAQYAFPPNRLGYCGPDATSVDELDSHAREFDGAWPYLQALAEAAGVDDPLDDEVVRSYWVGGRLLDKVDPRELLRRLHTAFAGQSTGLLGALDDGAQILAHHSFHVFVVYPWVRFLERDPSTPVRVMQDCRIRWGTVESCDGDHVVIRTRPLIFTENILSLGESVTERVRWSENGEALACTPVVGDVVTAHWDWICGTLTEGECDALSAATQSTLDLVNGARTMVNP